MSQKLTSKEFVEWFQKEQKRRRHQKYLQQLAERYKERQQERDWMEHTVENSDRIKRQFKITKVRGQV